MGHRRDELAPVDVRLDRDVRPTRERGRGRLRPTEPRHGASPRRDVGDEIGAHEDADGDEYAQDEETRELLAYDSTPARFLARRRGLFAEERGAIVHGVRWVGVQRRFRRFREIDTN